MESNDQISTEKAVSLSSDAAAPGAIDDTSTTASDKAARRRAQLRAAQQKRRSTLAASGAVTLTIQLTAAEAEILKAARELQHGAVAGFEKRALLTGAKFLANSGNKRGGKQRLK